MVQWVKVLSVQAWVPEFKSLTPPYKSGSLVKCPGHQCWAAQKLWDPEAWLLARLFRLVSLGSERDPISNTRRRRRRTWSIDFCLPCTCTVRDTNIHTAFLKRWINQFHLSLLPTRKNNVNKAVWEYLMLIALLQGHGQSLLVKKRSR